MSRPNQELQKDRSQGNSLLRQFVLNPAAIARRVIRHDDPSGLQLLQTVRENVSRDALTRVGKLLERPIAANHEVAHDQQGPAVAKYFDRDVDGTPGAPLSSIVFGHTGHVINVTCKMQVKKRDLLVAGSGCLRWKFMTDPTASVWAGIAANAEWERAELRRVEDKVITLFDQLRTPLLRYLFSFGLPVHEAEEIVQDAFLALFRHLRSGKNEANLRAWVFRVGHNLALKRTRCEFRRAAVVADTAGESLMVDPSPNPEVLAVGSQTRRRLQVTLDALPERDGQCLRLRAEGLRFREIADVLGISVGAVSLSLTRSVARLARAAQR